MCGEMFDANELCSIGVRQELENFNFVRKEYGAFDMAGVTAIVYDRFGKEARIPIHIEAIGVSEGSVVVDVRSLPSGAYTLRIRTSGNAAMVAFVVLR